MAAYHALSAMANPNSPSLSIRGAASAPARVVASALRGAGISARSHGMDVDVDGDRGVVRRGAPPRRARPSGPLDQVGALLLSRVSRVSAVSAASAALQELTIAYHLRLAGIVHHRARSRAINRTANLRAVQPEEAGVAAYPMQAEYRRAHPQASLLFDKHRPKLKRTMRNRNCQESCRVQR